MEDSCEAGAEAGKRLPWPSGPGSVTYSLHLNWKWRGCRRVRQTSIWPCFPLCRGTLCTIGNYRCSPETHTKLLTCCHTLFYAACHVWHDCNVFCLTHIQLCHLLFLTSLLGISLRQTFLPLFRLKSLFTTVLFHIKACSLTPFALRAPKSLESFWGSWSL